MTISTWDSSNKGTNIVLSNGNLTAANPHVSSNWACVLSSTSKSSGKVYAEQLIVTLPNDGVSNGASFQIAFALNNQSLNSYISASGDCGFVRADMSVSDGAASGVVSYTTGNRGYTSAVAGDVIQIAIDLDAGKAWTGKNNTFGGDPAAGTNPAFTWTPGGSWFIAFGANPVTGSNDPASTLHTATSNQTYSAPSGFTAWDGAGGAGGFFGRPYYDLSTRTWNV